MRLTAVLGLALLTACGQGEVRRESKNLQTYDVQEEATDTMVASDASTTPAGRSASLAAPPATSTPDISPTAAPGVAFNYRYAFRLENNRIARVQEAHARACETLGVDRCRITGMRYRLVDERDVDAQLRLALDPAIARGFGKQAEDAVVRAEGMLVNMEIAGEDVGSDIDRAVRAGGDARREAARIERDLARPGLDAVARERLLVEQARLRERERAAESTRREGEDRLARTPMVFDYGSGNVVPGFDGQPLRNAWRDAGRNLTGALAAMITFVSVLLPWAVLIALAIWLVRRLRPGWLRIPRLEGEPQA